MTTPYKGKYSNSISFSPKKRFVILQAQRNTPLLDAEVREISEGLLDLNKWLARNSFGDFAVISRPYSDYPGAGGSHRVEGFKVTAESGGSNLDFTVFGGLNSSGYNDLPAVMYLKGYYIFLSTDVKWSDQSDDLDQHLEDAIKEYPAEVIPDASSDVQEKMRYALRSDTFVKDVGQLQAGTAGQKDIVYVELTLDEVTDGGYNPNPEEQDIQDPSLRDPVIGNDTANRVRASAKFVVAEDWDSISSTDPLTGNIYNDPFFNEGEYDSGVRYLRAPLALLTRSHSTIFQPEDFTDLIEVHDKRIYPPVEITHRLLHGGVTPNDVVAGRASAESVDEKWGATGMNQGVGTEAYNTSSVTPRVLSKTSDFRMQSLAVAGVTGAAGMTGPEGTVQPDPDGLEPGEVTSKKIYSDKFYAGPSDSRKTIEEIRTLLPGSNVILDGEGGTGSLIKFLTEDVGTTGAGYPVDNHAWTQYFKDSGLRTLVSQLDREGRLALAKEVNGFSGYHLDVGEMANFDKHVDFRGDTNQFWNDFGASGTASIYNMEWDRQTNMFRTPPRTSPYWKMCGIRLYPGETGEINFVLHLSSYGGEESTTWESDVNTKFARYKVRVSKPETTSEPIVEVVALEHHNMLQSNISVGKVNGLGTDEIDLKMFIYIGADESDNTKGYSYKVTDFVQQGQANLEMFSSHSTTWYDSFVDAVSMNWLVIPSYFKYGEGYFSNLYAGRYSYKMVEAEVSSSFQKFPIAQRSVASDNYYGAQTYTVKIKGRSGAGWTSDVEAYFRIRIHASGTPGTRNLEVMNMTRSNGTLHTFDAAGLKSVGLAEDAVSEYLYLELAYVTALPFTGDFFFDIDIAEEPSPGVDSMERPFLPLGEYYHRQSVSPITGTDLSKIELNSLPGNVEELRWYSQAALATDGRVHLAKGSLLDLYDRSAQGTTGAGGSAALIRDMDMTLGRDGQYLSAAMGGVKWKDTPLHVVENIAELRTLDPSTLGAELVFVKGYYEANDGGGGIFEYVQSSSVSDDGGIYIAFEGDNSNTGRFVRYVENKEINVYFYGAIPQSGVSRDYEFFAAIRRARLENFSLLIPPSNVPFATYLNVEFPKGVSLTIGAGVSFENISGGHVGWSFKGPTAVNSFDRLTHDVSLIFHPTALTEVRVEWWGAKTSNTGSQNTEYLTNMYDDLTRLIYDGATGSSKNFGITAVFGDNGIYWPTGYPPGNFYKIGSIDLKVPTKFAGSSGLSMDGNVTVSEKIIAPNRRVFYFRDGRGMVYWSPGSEEGVNVNWFGCYPEDNGSFFMPDTTGNALQRMLTNFDADNSVRLYFPPGTYDLETSTTDTIDFGDNIVDIQPGALLEWETKSVYIRNLADTPSTKFNLQADNLSDIRDLMVPFIGGGVIRPEWFTSHGDFGDEYILSVAFATLARTTRVSEGDDLLDEAIAQRVSVEGEQTVLECSGKKYLLENTAMFSGGSGVSSSSRNLIINGLNLEFVSRPAVDDKLIDFWGTGSRGGIGFTFFNLKFINCVFSGYANSDYLPESGKVSLEGCYNTTFEKCFFRRAGIHKNSSSTIGGRPYIDGLVLDNCTSIDSVHDLREVRGIKILNSKFQDTLDFGTPQDYDRHMLYVTAGIKVHSCTFKAESIPSARSESEPLLIAILSLTGDVDVQGCDFENTKIQVEPVQNSTVYTVRGSSILGNRFFAGSGYQAVYNKTLRAVDSFIKIVAPSSDCAMENMVITGNHFTSLETSVGLEQKTRYGYILEAISLDENGGRKFDDQQVFDVIVKYNSASPNINVRGTEVVESVVVEGPNRNLDSENWLQIPPVTTDNGYSPSRHLVYSHKRLIGIPRDVKVSVDTNTSSWQGFVMGTVSSYGNLTEDQDYVNSERYSAFRLIFRHMDEYSLTMVMGLPGSTSEIKFNISVSFKTYKTRAISKHYPDESIHTDSMQTIRYV